MNLAKLLVLAGCVVALGAPLAVGQVTPAPDQLTARVVSARPDMVSGGDALIEITGPSAVIHSQELRVLVNGQDQTDMFRRRPGNDPLVGRVQGLKTGDNTLEVRVGDRSRATLALTNYPITGPIFSGPHQTPFVCQTEAAGLGPSLDANCTADTLVSYIYKSTDPPPAAAGRGGAPGGLPSGFKSYDPSAARPADVAQTTTSEGHVVDYIVRREQGTINRAIYEVAFLHDPGEPLPDPWSRTPGWNGRLVYSFGGGCAAGYRQGRAPGATSDAVLSGGYAIATSSLNVFGNNCNDVLSAETLMMVQEHFIEQFGAPVHTIGMGGSGGSMQQHLIAQNYPGMLDGITPGVSYPDITTIISNVVDCSLLTHAFETATEVWTEEQKTAVSGFATWRTCTESWNRSFSPALILPKACNPVVPSASVYDPDTNPTGVRCDVYENSVNLFGRDPKTGFARRTLDNVGVQYGLVALKQGRITPEQFLSLNQQIGGYDQDGKIVADRTSADPVALRAAYASGRVNDGAGELGSIPIIDFRPYLDATGDIHDSFRSFVTRARLLASTGQADNHVILRAPLETRGNRFPVDTIRLMDAWLDNIAQDPSTDAPAVKMKRNRPADIRTDACWTEGGEQILEPASYTGDGRCNELYPPFADPRIAAGGPLADNILKCTLKPIDGADYEQSLTADHLSRLDAIFPNGVCDYTQPGAEQRPTGNTWQTF